VSGSHTGLVLSERASVTCTGAPPLDLTTQMELGAMFPRLVELPQGDSPKAKTGFPETKAIHSPSGDHAREWAAGRPEIRLGGPPSAGRT
jgi:hypothetical protein